MATAPTYNRVSPGVYRSSTGQLVRQGQIKRPVPSTPTTQAPSPYATSLRNAGKGYYRGNDGSLIAGSLMNRMTDKFNNLAKQWGTLKQGDAQYNEIGNSLKGIGSKYGFGWDKVLGKDWKPYEAPAPAAAAPAPAAAEPTPAAPEAAPAAPAAPAIVGSQYANYQSPMTAALMKALGEGMNTMQAYEPKNFEGSPLYQFQKQKGMQDMEKLMAARGLTGSGAEVQANSDFLVNLNAQESEKQRQYADQAAQRQQQAMQFIANFDQAEKNALRDQWNTDLDRQTNISQFEANRGDRRQELATSFLSNILGLQSQNDIARIAQGGLNSQSALTEQLMKAISGFTANNYARSYGGGGGAAPTPPSSGNLDIARILMDYSNRAGNNDMLDGILRMFGGGK